MEICPLSSIAHLQAAKRNKDFIGYTFSPRGKKKKSKSITPFTELKANSRQCWLRSSLPTSMIGNRVYSHLPKKKAQVQCFDSDHLSYKQKYHTSQIFPYKKHYCSQTGKQNSKQREHWGQDLNKNLFHNKIPHRWV